MTLRSKVKDILMYHRTAVVTKKLDNSVTDQLLSLFSEEKKQVYGERDRLVCALSKLFPSHLARHPEEDKEWEDDWRWIVCIHLPAGQATWHIHDSERDWFNHLEVEKGHWDGHTTEEKYKRIEELQEELK